MKFSEIKSFKEIECRFKGIHRCIKRLLRLDSIQKKMKKDHFLKKSADNIIRTFLEAKTVYKNRYRDQEEEIKEMP